MGRHTKYAEAGVLEETPSPPAATDRMKWISRVPLLPAVAGAVAIGVCAAAWSTSQISLNFAGGGGASPNGSGGSSVQDSASRKRGAARPDGVAISFRRPERSGTDFTGTVVISNRGDKPVTGWTLAFKIPNAKVLSVTNGVLVKPGTTIATVKNSPYSATIKPGEMIRVAFTARGAAGGPSACTFNRTSCGLKKS